jgi:SAM-dependent methyltransferase
MLELFLAMALAVFTLVTGRDYPLLLVLLVLIALPGLWATRTGAPSIPTRKKTLDRMLKLADIKPGERVYDLGCGDGRIVFAAGKAGARATGYELSLPTFLLAKIRGLLHPSVKIEYKNFWIQDYREADVIFCYLLIRSMQTFESTIWPNLKPDCRVVSHAFRMKGVEPTAEEKSVILYVKK